MHHPGERQVRPVNAVAIIGDAFTLAGRHGSVVFGASLILQVGILALSFLAMNSFGIFGILVWLILTMAAYQVSMGIYTLFLLHLRHGHELTSPVYLLKESAPFALSLCWLGVISSVGIGIGLLFFIVPGLILALRWAVAAPALVAQRVSATDALSISGNLVSGAYGTVFVLALIQNVLVNVVPRLIMNSDPMMPIENVLIAQAVLAALTTPIVAIASAELFLRLAGVPDRIPTEPAAAAPAGPYVPSTAIPQTPQPAYPQPTAVKQPYAAPAQQPYAAPAQHPFVPPSQPHVVPTAPHAYPPQPPAAPSAPQQPYVPAPPQAAPAPAPDAPARSQSVGPPGTR